MKYSVIPLSVADVPAAVGVLLPLYAKERDANPLLPLQMMGSDRKVESSMKRSISNGAVGLLSVGQMIGFMAISSVFQFKGQRATLIGEVCHGVSMDNKIEAYQLLYKALGEHLQRQRVRLHIIAHFANDNSLQEVVYQLGFGAFLAERVRPLTVIDGAADVEISQEADFSTIQDLEIEHMKYYRQPPIYLWKDDSEKTVQAQLQDRQEQGDALFVYMENGKPAAYFMVGLCRGDHDGRILRDTNTAQVLSAYATPSVRGKGIGKALLNKCIEWAYLQRFSRLYVEHETANIYGGNFWRRHFSPCLYFSMRYIEDCL